MTIARTVFSNMRNINRLILATSLMSFSSGAIFFFLVSTLVIWLKENGVSKATIGLFCATTLPYGLKFLFGMLIDRYKSPFGDFLGNRRGWALISQLMIIISFASLILFIPEKNLFIILCFCFILSIAAVLQDIAIETYRISSIAQKTDSSKFKKKLGISVSFSYIGFRLGMMSSGAAALFIVEFFSWKGAFFFIMILECIGIVGLFLAPKQDDRHIYIHPPHKIKSNFFENTVIAIRKFWSSGDWGVILSFTIIYKLCDSSLHAISNILYLEIGFSRIEIASLGKIWWIIFATIGAIIASFSIRKFSVYKTLLIGSIMQILVAATFLLQYLIGNNIYFLFITATIDSLTSALCTVAVMAYRTIVSGLSDSIALNISVIGSISSFARILINMMAFFIANSFGWIILLSIVFIYSIISLFFVIKMHDRLSSY